MRLLSCFPRASFFYKLLRGTVGAFAANGGLSDAAKDDDEDGEQESGLFWVAYRATVFSRPFYTLLVDGVADSVGYF